MFDPHSITFFVLLLRTTLYKLMWFYGSRLSSLAL
jgi:hypothetical protein